MVNCRLPHEDLQNLEKDRSTERIQQGDKKHIPPWQVVGITDSEDP